MHVCPTCGTITRVYRQSLTRLLVGALAETARVTRVGDHIRTDAIAGLSRSEKDNFQKLIYWDLVERPLRDDGTRVQRGRFVITQRGRDFLAGNLAVHAVAHTQRGVRLKYDGPLVTVWEIGRPHQSREDFLREAI